MQKILQMVRFVNIYKKGNKNEIRTKIILFKRRNAANQYRKVIRTRCIESVEKILSLRDIFHLLQLGAEIDRLTEEKAFRGPIQTIMENDLGVFGVDEIFGLDIARLYGAIGQTNFGDIDVNKPGIVAQLNEDGKSGKKACHTFLDDIVGAIAAAASTRVAQIWSEEQAAEDRKTA